MPRHTHAAPDQESVIDPQQPRALNLSRFTTNQYVNTILVAQSCTILQTKYYSRQWELYPHQPLLLGTRTHSWCPSRHVTNAVYGGRESSPTKGKTGTVPTQVWDSAHAGLYSGSGLLPSTASPVGLRAMRERHSEGCSP